MPRSNSHLRNGALPPAGLASCAFVLAVLPVAAALGVPPKRPPAKSKPAAAPAGYAQIGKPFVQVHCVRCHGPEVQKARLRLDTLPAEFSDPAVASKWAEVLTAVNNHQMPPSGEKQPTVESAGKFAD